MAMRWYIVHTYSGYENKVKANLEERIKTAGMQDRFGRILVPMEKVVELVKGQKKESSRKFYPGYVLIQMEMNEDTWHLVNETPKVTGFLGGLTDPVPVPDEEAEAIIAQIETGTLQPRPKYQFEQGDEIRVIDGPFSNFNGIVEEVKPDKGKLRVLISIFGRSTPVELEFVQVSKI
jgi:transcription termination/antitermination protein NusG